MGQSLSQIIETKPDAKLLQAERRMRDKLESNIAKLYIGALNDECIAIVCAVAKFDHMLYIEDITSIEPRKAIESIIRRYLDMEGDNPDEKSDNKLIELVTRVVKSFPSHEQGTYEGHHVQVVYANKGFIRFDFFICLQILDDNKAVLSYYGQVGLMNETKAKPEVLKYELRRATDDDKLKKAGEQLKKSKNPAIAEVGAFLLELGNKDP